MYCKSSSRPLSSTPGCDIPLLSNMPRLASYRSHCLQSTLCCYMLTDLLPIFVDGYCGHFLRHKGLI